MANLTIDIIYYKTASDFEMEFNLTGCCRMRMFKDKVDSQKDLVNALARDVSRSTITIIVTDLFGENSGIATISKAIRLPLTALDKASLGVKAAEEFVLPETAVPLVTSEGLFGGCIIANGPQSIIIVTSGRPLRHEIMKKYIHNYVFDIGQYIAYQNRIGNPSDILPPMPEIHPITPNAASQNVENKADTESETDKETVEDIPVLTEDVEKIDINASTEDSTTKFTVLQTDESLDSDDLLSGVPLVQNIPQKTKSKRGRSSNIVLLIIVLMLLVSFGILAYYFVYLPLLNQPGTFTDGSGNIITDFLNNLFS